MKMFDGIVVVNDSIPNLDDISKQLKDFYGDGFVEANVKSADPDVLYSNAGTISNALNSFEELISKLNAESDRFFANNNEGALIALVRCNHNVASYYYCMLIDLIIKNDLCRDVYYVKPKKTGIVYNDPSEIPLVVTKYDAPINKNEDEWRELIYEIDMNYDDTIKNGNLITYLSSICQKYLSILEALEGLDDNQKAQLLTSILNKIRTK